MNIVKLNIHTITRTQLEQMVDMELNCGLEPYSREMLIACIKDLHTFACMDAGKIVGFITLMGNYEYMNGSIYIVNLNVAQSHRRNGIAEVLIRIGSSILLNQYPHPWVTLDVAKSNLPARSLYRKLGFRISRIPSSNGDTDIVMCIPGEMLRFPNII